MIQTEDQQLRSILLRSAVLLLPCVLAAALARGELFTLYQVQTQDLFVLLALPWAFLLVRYWSPTWSLPRRLPALKGLLLVGFAAAALLAWGCHVLVWNFPVSRDEIMVVFDMAVYEKGRLAEPLDPVWRDYARALVPAFLLNEWAPLGLVSAYLPINALMRLAFAQIADPALMNPLLAVAGAVALLDIAKRMFGEDTKAIWVSLLVYVLSAQMLANAMTVYAMTGHMALNLIWLAAFLRGGKLGHAVAIAVALLATGLHQLAFHPLFAAPFVFWRLRQGAWRVALLYAVAYALIVCWWIAYPLIASLQTGVAAVGRDDTSLIERVTPLLLQRDPNTVPLMLLNLVRFIAWQHLALLPLFLAAATVAWRDPGPAAPMLWGIALIFAFLAVVLPFQGHGWGYRYFHPNLGSFALLAGFGYRRLAEGARLRADGAFLILSALTVFGSTPILLSNMREFIRPHVLLDRHIERQATEFVVVDTQRFRTTADARWASDGRDEVRNRPDLANRPLRISSIGLDDALAVELCRRGTVSTVSLEDMRRLGVPVNVPERNSPFERLMRIFEKGGCLRGSAFAVPDVRS